MIGDGSAGVVECVSVGFMLCGLAGQVAGLCWLPFNLHPEDGMRVEDFYAFGLVLVGAGVVGFGLMIRLCHRVREACALELMNGDRGYGE